MAELWNENGIGTRLGEALITLLHEYSMEQISVKMICQKAGINRSTFYNYFDDKYQLCDAVMNASIEVFLGMFEERIDQANSTQKTLKPEQYLLSSETLEYYLELVREHRDVFRLFALNEGPFYSSEQYEELVNNIVLPVLQQYQIDDVRQADYMSAFYLGAIHSVVLSWIENDCEESVKYIANIIRRCLHVPEEFISVTNES